MLLFKWNMHQSQNPISDGITWKHHRVKEYVSYLLEKGQKWGMREQNRKDKKTTLIGTHLAKKDIFYRWLQELQYSVGSWPYIYIAEEKQWRIYAYNSWWLLMWWLRTAQRYSYWINKQQESSKEILTSFGKELWYGLPSEMCRKIERVVPAKKLLEKYKSCKSSSEVLFEVASVGTTEEKGHLLQTQTVDERKLKSGLTFLRDE